MAHRLIGEDVSPEPRPAAGGAGWHISPRLTPYLRHSNTPRVSQAASQGSVLEQANRLAAQGKPAEAIALITRAAGGGDAKALFAMAHWRLFGMNGPRIPEEGRRYAIAAAAAGHAGARHLEVALVANGVGGPADPAAARALLDAIDDPAAARARDLLDAMAEDAADRRRVVLSATPSIATIPALLSPRECAYLIDVAAPHMQRSQINDAAGRHVVDPLRTSSGMAFGWTRSDPVIAALNRRFAQITGTAVEAGEPLQVLRYEPGEEYRPHLDAIPGETNQRQWTLLVMLRPSAAGGETGFPALNRSIRLAQGEGLLFRNVTPSGEVDRATIHAGLPVTEGEKWLATRWIRRHAFAG